MAEWPTLGGLGEKIPADVIAVPAPRVTSSDLVHVPRNPARAPQGLEDAIYGMAVKPLSDIGMGIGSVVEGQGWNSPEASAGFLAAMGLLTPMRAGALRPSIKAYHVSPYDFDKFDMSKIGTGQGAQAYGHGIYAAENPKVSGGPNSEYWQYFADRFTSQQNPEGLATLFLRAAEGDRVKAIAKLRDPEFQRIAKDWGKHPQRVGNEGFQNVNPEDAIRLLESDKPVGPRTYEVSINAKPEQFLDWDRPLAGQPEHFSRLREAGVIGDKSPPYQKSGQATPQALVQMPGEKGAIEAQLRDAGIPGIRYLDQGSRSATGGNGSVQFMNGKYNLFDEFGGHAGQFDTLQQAKEAMNPSKPTSNYVLFRDDIIDILRKYGIMAPASGVALDQATQRQ
jgi:hypothetical protein